MEMKVAEDMFDPSEFEEPELYESMKILKSLKHFENGKKKSSLHDLKKTSKKEMKKEKDRIKFKLKRPCLDLEKMMKVVQTIHTQAAFHSPGAYRVMSTF